MDAAAAAAAVEPEPEHHEEVEASTPQSFAGDEATPRDHVRMEVECPEGVEAGQMIVLTTADGRDVEIEVPADFAAAVAELEASLE